MQLRVGHTMPYMYPHPNRECTRGVMQQLASEPTRNCGCLHWILRVQECACSTYAYHAMDIYEYTSHKGRHQRG